QRSRPLAQLPRVVQFAPPSGRDPVRALMPIDPASGGTWVAVNDAGLAVALLNVNRQYVSASPPPRSRGEIVPMLAAMTSLDAMVDAARALDRGQYQPFRLVCAGWRRVVEIDPHLGVIDELPTRDPLMFTSSGLGDDLVEEPRRQLFAELVGSASANSQASAQDRFHAHRWESMPHVSVFMSRDDASTVSRTVVEIGPERLRMIYAAAPEWTPSEVELAPVPSARRAQREDNSR
ncbi:MAG TPA: NRDE family protein, partial [Vicinamibacterales bacterium]|nr:NRDE family protein [Vicinamibacterales bacterium]